MEGYMPWTKKVFQNKPSTATPLTAGELNNLGDQYAAARADAVTDVAADIGDTGTAVGAALSTTYVRFLDENGDPLVGKLVTITVNSTTGEIDDITSEDI